MPAGECQGPSGSKSSLSVATSPCSKAANARRTTALFASDEESGDLASSAHAANEETSKRVRPSLCIHDTIPESAIGMLPIRPRLSGEKRRPPSGFSERLGGVVGLTASRTGFQLTYYAPLGGRPPGAKPHREADEGGAIQTQGRQKHFGTLVVKLELIRRVARRRRNGVRKASEESSAGLPCETVN